MAELQVDRYIDSMLGGNQQLLGSSVPPSFDLVNQAGAEIDSYGYPYVLREKDIVIPPLERETPSYQKIIARPPVVDRFPIQLGQGITSSYLSAAYRLCVSGWRYQFVDLANELIDYDPHARAVSRQRVLSTAGGRFEIRPARLPPNDPKTDIAKEISDAFEADFENVPARTQAVGQLNWGVVYGMSGSEIEWDVDDSHWFPVALSNIHSRRLNFPNPSDWELRIYDQGLVGPGYGGMGPTTGNYGLPVSLLPGKFIIHAPALNGDYPTRDGEVRYAGMYMLVKRMVVRATTEDFERTIRPWVIGYFNRDLDSKDGARPIATEPDQLALDRVLASLGAGSLNYGRLPDSVKVEILRAASSYSVDSFLSFLNREISKCFLGQSFTTEPGANGNLTTSEIAKKGTMEVLRYDARALADTYERDLARPWLKLNYPGESLRLCPRITIAVDELPSPKDVADVAYTLTQCDVPVDVDSLSEKTNTKVTDPDDKKARRTRMVGPGKGPTPPDPDEPGAEDEAAQAQADAADQSNEPTDAAQPPKEKPNGKAAKNGKATPAKEN
jgi:phage gp29-like protein